MSIQKYRSVSVRKKKLLSITILIGTFNPDPEIFRLLLEAIKKYCTDEAKGKRVYLVFDPNSSKDRFNLFKYVIYSLTIIEPLMESIRGFLVIPDPAWFLHPLMCILMVFGYGWSEIERKLRIVRDRV